MLFFSSFLVLGIDLRALCLQGCTLATELNPQHLCMHFYVHSQSEYIDSLEYAHFPYKQEVKKLILVGKVHFFFR